MGAPARRYTTPLSSQDAAAVASVCRVAASPRAASAASKESRTADRSGAGASSDPWKRQPLRRRRLNVDMILLIIVNAAVAYWRAAGDDASPAHSYRRDESAPARSRRGQRTSSLPEGYRAYSPSAR